jgi:GTPase
MSKLYNVAIVGRVNVGKSTLFNRLLAANKAIISNVAGTTRDRNYAVCTWKDLDFNIIDTGGLVSKAIDKIDKAISEQALQAVKEADLILFVVDSKTGIMPEDTNLTKILQKTKKPVLLVANKTDNNKARQNIAEFYKLNFDEPWPTSATSGVGTGDLLDEVVKELKKIKKPNVRKSVSEEESNIKVAIVGRPNVGKSSLINALLGAKRLVVSSTPHTTRDAQDIILNFEKQKLTLIDTAGIRRRSKKSKDGFEKQSVEQSLKTLKRADIMILMTDVSKKLSWQDKHLINEAQEHGVGIIIVANKWDLIPEKDKDTINEYTKYYQRFLPFITWAPIIFTSATQKIRLKRLLTLMVDIYKEKNKTITENGLSKLLKKIVKKHKPSRGKGTKHPYIYSLKQIRTNPPVFAIKMNFKAELHDSYLRFIENNLRYKFGFEGVPIKIVVNKSQNVQDT